MARIKVLDRPLAEDLSEDEMKGVIGGTAEYDVTGSTIEADLSDGESEAQIQRPTPKMSLIC